MVQFSSPFEAKKAHDCTEAILNNRFIRVYYLRKDDFFLPPFGLRESSLEVRLNYSSEWPEVHCVCKDISVCCRALWLAVARFGACSCVAGRIVACCRSLCVSGHTVAPLFILSGYIVVLLLHVAGPYIGSCVQYPSHRPLPFLHHGYCHLQ